MTDGTTHPGRLIVFEGPDGVGKSTIAGRIARSLEPRGQPTVLVTFPGQEAGTLGRLVYDLHHDPSRFGVGGISPIGKQAMHIAAHLDAIERVIRPAMRSGKTVVLDRFWWSTWVYGTVAGVDRQVLQALIDAELSQWKDLMPAPAILLRCLSPLGGRPELGDWLVLRREYDRLASREQERHPLHVVENVGALDDVVHDILDILLLGDASADSASHQAEGSDKEADHE